MDSENKKEADPPQKKAGGKTRSDLIFGLDAKAIFAIVAILAVVAAIVVFLPQKPMPATTTQPELTITPGANVTAPIEEIKGGAQVLIASLNKVVNMPKTYSIEYKRPVDFDLFFTVEYQNASAQMGGLRTPYNNRTAYIVGNTSVFCEQIVGSERKCVTPTKGKDFLAHMYGIQYMFVDAEGAKNAVELNSKLIGYGALVADKATTEKMIAGRKCTEVTYTLNFDNLTLSQINGLNVATQYGNQKHKECLDDEFGLPLEQTVEYVESGEAKKTYFVVTAIEAPMKNAITVPQPNAQEQDVYSDILKAEGIWEVEAVCGKMNGTDADGCFKAWSVQNSMPSYCSRIQNASERDSCYHIGGTKLFDKTYCALAGSLSDQCYYSIATTGKVAGACSEIANTTLQAECMNATKSK